MLDGSSLQDSLHRVGPLHKNALCTAGSKPCPRMLDGPGLGDLTHRVGPLHKNAAAEGLVLILHGAGGSADCFEPYAEEWSKAMPSVAFLMPSAPQRGTLTTWFARARTERIGKGVQPKLINFARVQAELLDLLKTECQRLNLDLGQVAILGYSAGSLMASWLVLQLPQPCAGLVCLHGLCPDGRLPDPPPCPTAGRPEALCLAGGRDRQVPPEAVQHSVKLLRDRWQFPEVSHRVFPEQGHGISVEECDVMVDFFRARLQRAPR